MIKKIMLCLAMLSLSFNSLAKAEEQPEIIGEYGIAIDATTGEILYEKNANEKANPASITKVMTAILLDERAQDGDMIKVSENARIQECSCFVFEEGESIEKLQAMNALMIVSANDLAMAIAEHVGGSQAGFGKIMTEKAREVGAKNTTFTTPSGLTEPNHLTTAYDMAMIAKEALNHPNVIHAMSLKEEMIQTDKREKQVVNSGKVHDNPLVIAGKTGYTSAAGHTLVEILEKDGKRVISVVMKSSKDGKYTDVMAMADYAFDRLDTKEVVVQNSVIKTEKINGKEVNLLAEDSLNITYIKGEEPAIEQKVVLKEDITKKTVSKGDKVGELEVYKGESLVKKIDLLSDKAIEAKTPETPKTSLTFLVIILPILVYVGYVVWYNNKRRKVIRDQRGIS